MKKDTTATASRRGKSRVQRARSEMYRNLVVEAAEELFADRGVADTRMERIAAHAGLSLGTLYSVFAGKGEIVGAIHEARLAEVLQRAVDAARGADGALDMLLAGIRTYVRFFVAHPHYLRMHLREGYSWASGSSMAGTAEQAEAWREGIAMQASLFERGITEGAFYPGDPLVMTRMMIALQEVQLSAWVDAGMSGDADRLVAEVEEQFRRSFCRPD